MDIRAPLSDNITSTQASELVADFVRSVRRAKVEHMWTALGNGEVIKTKGTPDSVPTPDTGDELVVLEIHQHAIDELKDDPRRAGFLHLSDIGASFNGGMRVFGTYLVLVQAPSMPYVVGASFSVASKKRFLAGDKSPHDSLYRTIEGVHASPARFTKKLSKAANLPALTRLYEQTLPELEFGVWPVENGRLRAA